MSTSKCNASSTCLAVATSTVVGNPVIFFDELDKVSDTAKCEEIINILMHITDSTQNSHFSDRYFTGLDFDLSKAIIIFSFNDAQKVSRILKDRMKIIKVDGYKIDDKIEIAQRHLIPKLFKSIGLTNVEFSDEIIRFIADSYTNEGGVRKLKSLLYNVFREINIASLLKTQIDNGQLKNIKIVDTKEINKKYKIKFNNTKNNKESHLII
jgi:ATP-dependent Lon protease